MRTTYDAVRYVAVSDAAVGSIGAFVGGLVIVGVLVWAVRLGIKSRRGQPRPPRPEEQPRRPASGPAREARETRQPDEVPRAADESERPSPHDLHASGSERGENQDRPRWDPGSSGSFGGGGPGRT